ncbi:hemin ABC transporter substrate-binding protein [Maritimibacter sp. 55A14]|uniref:heme/hemin ABC transporter substrate-binding protein n=1 Tax=Maritimibacter sp. 55A14 TaxID=2174844 RepID=UPI000D61254F|nr:ABC transporter substrate-binding protein [Maritimibacter sp. 55A14]PWE33369.1 hemin ABC transporter substrate-binding protein [Maritimibacter sp. 55A14]
MICIQSQATAAIRRRTLLLGGAAAIVLPTRAGAADAPMRVIVAGGALTEIVFALGAGGRVVGADSTSTWPEAARALPQVGYFRDLAPEGLLSLTPDLLLAEYGVGPASTLDRLAAAGLRVAIGPDVQRAAEIPRKIAFAGHELGRERAATALAASFRADLARISGQVARLKRSPRVLFVLSLQSGAPVVGGAGTAAEEMILCAGGTNAGAEVTGYRPMSREAILAAAPEAVVMMDHQARSLGSAATVFARPEFAATPAARVGRAIALPGAYLVGMGPRTPHAIADLARALHPDAADRLDL